MEKMGDSLPIILDKAVDFMASTQAFKEYMKQSSVSEHIPEDIPDEKVFFYIQRLNY
ncbi:hypothetical protein TUM17576_51510 [Enterobacter hormaechei]|nr:hypothetical protein [Enterobacter hormaechei]GJL38331.1 hypothetical protein TUM17576_51510 [Enterobacter hormaechei]